MIIEAMHFFKDQAARRLAMACVILGFALFAGAQSKSGFAPARYVLSLDGQGAEAVKSFKGGGVYSEVIVSPNAGANGGSAKHPGPPRFEDIVVELPLSSPLAQQLVSSMWQGQAAQRNGSLMAVDSSGNSVSELQFRDALVTEVTVPACDGASKEPFYLTIKLAPEQIQNVKGSGKATASGASVKASLSSAFRLDIDGVDCKNVRRIEPLTAKLGVISDAAGEQRMAQKQAGALEFGNVRLVVPQSAAEPFRQWFDQFIMKGETDMERAGSLTFLAADLKTAVAVIRFENLGIIRISPVVQSGAERGAEVAVEMYCERMELGGAAAAGGAAGTGGDQTASSAPPPTTQPAPTATLRDRSGLTTREPIARPGTRLPPPEEKPAAQDSKAFLVQPNAKLAADIGRLVVRFPDGTEQRDYQLIRLPKSKQEATAGEIFYGSMAKELAPGQYLVSINGMLVEGVRVEGGSDTYLSVGVLRVKAPDAQQYEVILEDLDNAPAIARNVGSKDVALPVGSYFLRLKGNMTPFTIEDGQFTEFAAPE